jgi:hypothetical protein
MEAYRAESFSIAKCVRENGAIVTDAFLTLIVTELIKTFNVGKTMNDMQVVFVVNGIKSDYYFLKPEELKYCFENAKKGRYGTMYDRIDAAVIFGWLDEYMKERTELAYLENEEKNKGYKKLEITNPAIAEALKKVFKVKTPFWCGCKKLTVYKPINNFAVCTECGSRVKITRPRKLTEHEEIVQDIMREFDELYMNQPYSRDSKFRTIRYMDKDLGIDEFLTIRLEELNKL